MAITFKNNFRGYFNFYYSVVGNRFFKYLGLSSFISLLDGIGLAMFIPLLQFVNNKDNAQADNSLGQLQYLIKFLQWLGLSLNVTTILCVITSIFILKGVLKFVQLSYYARVRQYFIMHIRLNLIDKLQGLTYPAFLKLDAGKIQNTLTTEVNRLFGTMMSYFNAAQATIMLTTYIVLAFLANYQFAVLVGLGSILSNLIYKRIYRATKNASIEVSKKGSDFNGFLIQAIHNFKYLKSTNTFGTYARRLKKVIKQTENLNRKSGKLKAIGVSIKEPIVITIVSLVILVQLTLMGTGLNTIILSLLLFYRALNFLVAVQTEWQSFIENIGSMYTIATISEEMSAMQEVNELPQFSGFDNSIHFRNVTFFYDKVKALDRINIVIPSKKTIALIGESGSGKTTVANMIAGLFVPLKGDIMVDDIPLSQFNINSYRSKIGYISQEAVIFNDTIFNNVTFWAEPTAENVKRFHEAVAMASLSEFVARQPDGEFTRLGDNGILISGGQKQRISIARELYKNTEILILDEATSALDSETEKMIQENIEKLHGKYTMVLIAHRLSTIKDADIIYLLEGGKVSASGTFDQMINSSTRFKKMVSLQAV